MTPLNSLFGDDGREWKHLMWGLQLLGDLSKDRLHIQVSLHCSYFVLVLIFV